jgi:hypothetical protein
VLTADKKVYRMGALPKLTVQIINDGKERIGLVGSLDGSAVKWRYPHCYYTIEGPRSVETNLKRCGNMNPLRLQDFQSIEPGQAFDPYDSVDRYGFFTDPIIRDAETFKHPGIYTIRFHYSTKAANINQFLGDRSFRNDRGDSLRLDSMLRAVAKVTLTSNQIKIKVEE